MAMVERKVTATILDDGDRVDIDVRLDDGATLLFCLIAGRGEIARAAPAVSGLAAGAVRAALLCILRGEPCRGGGKR